jgi:hypothetical protein
MKIMGLKVGTHLILAGSGGVTNIRLEDGKYYVTHSNGTYWVFDSRVVDGVNYSDEEISNANNQTVVSETPRPS